MNSKSIYPYINMYILHNAPHKCPLVLIRRIWQSRASSFCNDFPYYHDLDIWFSSDAVRKIFIEVTLKAHLNGFNICFNLHSTLCWTKCLVRLNRSSNIVENIKVVESLLKGCWRVVKCWNCLIGLLGVKGLKSNSKVIWSSMVDILAIMFH